MNEEIKCKCDCTDKESTHYFMCHMTQQEFEKFRDPYLQLRWQWKLECVNQNMNEWVSVKDRIPTENENVILFDGKEVFCGSFEGYDRNKLLCYGNQSCDGICYGWYNKKEITHWMPLPQPTE
jgi:Protein of unknown function (DUF551)